MSVVQSCYINCKWCWPVIWCASCKTILESPMPVVQSCCANHKCPRPVILSHYELLFITIPPLFVTIRYYSSTIPPLFLYYSLGFLTIRSLFVTTVGTTYFLACKFLFSESPTIPDPCPSSIESAGAYFHIFSLITYYYLTAYYMCVGTRFSSEPHGFPSRACRTFLR
jgi:hypothetical protein